jgi:phosphatidylglycerophosphate synthase
MAGLSGWLLILSAPVLQFCAAAMLGAVAVAGIGTALPGAQAWATLVALGMFVLSAALAARSMQRAYPHGALGLCNLATLVRLGIVALLMVPLLSGAGASWAAFALAALALGLDGVDGWLARRQRLASEFGARFDMEVDAALGLVLALNAYAAGTAGPLVLLLGLPRYVFWGLGLRLPWLSRPLPERFGRKLACVIQIAALIVVQVPGLPNSLATAAITLAALALALSFGRDIRWLWQRRG